MATVPLSGTDISFYTGIPFSNDYKNTRWFDDITAQQNWFSTKTVVHTMSQATFQRDKDKTFIACNQSIDNLRNVNYLKFRNTTYNNKWFYAFVTKLEYRNTQTTYVHFQIDVMQTYRFDWNFKPSYVVREHCPQYYTDGMPVMNTIDEGLDYGTDYDTVQILNYKPYEDNIFMVIVAKQKMDVNGNNEITPMTNGVVQPLSYYVIPVKIDGTMPNVKVDGLTQTITPVKEALKAMYSMSGAVNNIVSIYFTEYLGKNISYDGVSDTFDFNMLNFEPVSIQSPTQTITVLYVASAQMYETRFRSFGDKYLGYAPVTESKLLMHPYTKLELVDFKGNRFEYKNELIDSDLLSITVRGSMGVSNKVAYTIQNYRSPNLSGTDLEDLSLEHSIINNSPNDVPIITDLLAAYLQGNKNSIATQERKLQFNGAMGVVNSALSMGMSVASRNPAGIAQGATDMMAGAGNTVLDLQAIQAKQQDIDNVPPQLNKMGSNSAFDFGNGYNGCYLIKKQIKAEYRKKLTDFFKMFGYKVNEVKIPNFHTRRSWNFVQTKGCYIRGNFSNEDLNEIKRVFDNGITLWHHEDMGNYDLDNSEV
jgi:hypothetical protein